MPLGLSVKSVADLLELLEDFRLIGGSNANSGVDDADDQFLVHAGERSKVMEPESVNLTAFEMRLMTT